MAIQEWLGHNNLKMIRICTHVANTDILGGNNQLD